MYDRSAEERIPRSIFWLFGLWVALALAALVWGVDNVETSLRDSARRSLAVAGHDGIAVDFSGRDARLIGTAESADVATDIAASIDLLPGVRNVESEIAVVEPVSAAISPEITVRLAGNILSVSGLIPSREVESGIITAAEAEFGPGRVVNSLVVSAEVEAQPWLGRIRDIFAHLGALRSGGFSAGASGLVIEGEVISEAAREETVNGITVIVGELLPVSEKMTVATLPEPTFEASGEEEVVTLTGVMPDQDTVDTIVEAAERLHANSVVVDRLDVGDVSGPAWLDAIGGLLDVVTRLDPWKITITEGTVTISGLALDQELVAGVGLLAEEVAGDLTVTTNVEVDPAAVATQLTQLLEGNATFESNGVELSSDGRALLDSAIAILNANPSAVLIVEGHTDDQGDEAENKVLSQRRAEAVVAYLVAGGIDPARLTAVGYGEENPIADNSTEEGRAQNRRIEFVIQEGDG